jgi:hypothetical protein
MSFDYSGDPADSAKDQVRFLVQDTDSDRELLQDEEIEWLLEVTPNVHAAAAEAALAIALRFAALPDRRVGGMSISYAQNTQHFQELATLLRRKANRLSLGKPYAGGVTVNDVFEHREDTFIVQPHIRLGMHDARYLNAGYWARFSA